MLATRGIVKDALHRASVCDEYLGLSVYYRTEAHRGKQRYLVQGVDTRGSTEYYLYSTNVVRQLVDSERQ